MRKIRNLTIQIEQLDKTIPIVEIESSVTVSELLNALADKVNMPVLGTQGIVIRRATQKQLPPELSFNSIGVKNGEILEISLKSMRDDYLRAQHLDMLNFRSRVVSWEPISGDPPESYRFKYHLKGLVGLNSGQPCFHTGFVVEVSIPKEYPDKLPEVRFTELPYAFHPNVWTDGHIALSCYRDWTPRIAPLISIPWLCQIIGETIALQVFSLGSPANCDKSLRNWVRWAWEKGQLPVDSSIVRLPDPKDVVQWGEEKDYYTFVVGNRRISSQSLYNIIVYVPEKNKIIPIEEVHKSVTAQELLDALNSRIGIETWGLIRKNTYERLPLYKPLGETNVKNGETLLVDFMYPDFTQVTFDPISQSVDMLHNLVILNGINGERHFIESVPSEITIEDLLSAFVDRVDFSSGAQGALIHRSTYKRLMLTQTLKSAYIVDGEELIAEFEEPTKLGAAEKFFELLLSSLNLTKAQILNQNLSQLKISLGIVNDAIRNPKQFDTVRVVNDKGVAGLADTTSDFSQEVGILPVFLERKRLILERLETFTGDEEMQKVKIMFLTADPTNTSRLRIGEELREIQEKLQLAKLREGFEFHQRMSVRPTDISQALLDIQPQIIHFSGHGTKDGTLCFENQLGEVHPIGPDALAALFEQFANQVNCVVLNACYSEIQAHAIAKHINYVIGMNQAIGDKAAIHFAVGFYQALGAGRSIEEAYKLGCIQIQLWNIPEHLKPVLVKKV